MVAITGAFGCLGLATARCLMASGLNLAMIDRDTVPMDVEREFSGHLLLGSVDLTNSLETVHAFQAIQAGEGRLTGLVNIAGGFAWETLSGGRVDTWDRLYAVNLRTAVNACQAALPMLVTTTDSSIVNISAAASAKGSAGMGAYAASKAGVARLTESLADELKDHGVRVNAILPAIIGTPQNRADMPNADFARWVAPTAIAQVVLFLLSGQASAVTGALLPVTHRC